MEKHADVVYLGLTEFLNLSNSNLADVDTHSRHAVYTLGHHLHFETESCNPQQMNTENNRAKRVFKVVV